MRTGATFQSLRNRNYRLYSFGTAISTVGTWMQFIAQDWLVLELTGGSGSALGITTALQFLPLLMFGLWGGLVADRYPKRLVLVVSQIAMGVLALILGVLTTIGSVQIWHVYVLATALGLARSVDNPTRQAFVIELVEPAARANAIALQGAVMTIGRVAGTAVAGVLIDVVGLGPVFLLNALSFAGVIAGLALMRREDLHDAPRVSRQKGQLRASLAYVRGRGDLMLVFALVAVVATFGMNPQMTTALMVKDVFHAGAGAFGLASTVFAVGSFAGALFAARAGDSTAWLILGAAFVFGALEAVSAVLPSYTAFLVLLPPTGLAMVAFNTLAIVAVQLGVAPEMRGRVSGLYVLVFAGTTPIGAPVIGWFAQEFGARAGLLAGGVLTIIATVAVAPPLVRARRS